MESGPSSRRRITRRPATVWPASQTHCTVHALDGRDQHAVDALAADVDHLEAASTPSSRINAKMIRIAVMGAPAQRMGASAVAAHGRRRLRWPNVAPPAA